MHCFTLVRPPPSQMLEQLRRKADSNIFIACLFMLVKYLLTLVELVTKFATVSVSRPVTTTAR